MTVARLNEKFNTYNGNNNNNNDINNYNNTNNDLTLKTNTQNIDPTD